MPEGAERYCRRLTWIWLGVLAVLAGAALADWRLSLLSPAVVALVFAIELPVRRKRFSCVFHTGGSTGKPKTIVKTFESLAKETAFHRDFYRNRFGADAASGILFISTVEPHHMYGTLWRKMLPEALGAKADDEVILTPESLVARMKTAQKVFLVTTPAFLERFTAYASAAETPQNCVEITTSGSLLKKDTAERTKSVFGVCPREIFGSTETGGVAARRRDEGDDWHVFDAVRVDAAEDGRLVVRSPFSFRRTFTMGDAVSLAPGKRSFQLHGRTDRLVKINEHRVDLAAAEEAVRALGFRDAALAVLGGRRGDFLGLLLCAGTGEPPDGVALRKELGKAFRPGTIPKRIRFVRELPRNAQGKVVASEVKRILESALSEPVVLDEDASSSGKYSATVRFEPSAPYFDGHFDSFPILPGVAQLGLASRWAAVKLLGDATMRPKAVKKMKFTQIIQPGMPVKIELAAKSQNEVAYCFKKVSAPAADCKSIQPRRPLQTQDAAATGDIVCSSGVLVF